MNGLNHNFKLGDRISFEMNDLWGSISTGKIVKVCKDGNSIRIKRNDAENLKEILTRPYWECRVIDSKRNN